MPLSHLLKRNSEWAEKVKAGDPDFFTRLAQQQKPEYLWIGCSDSRVPANQIVELPPGDIFVHRNIANCVVHTDLNCQSVIFFAVTVLKVKHIIVTGHYNCSGVKAALGNQQLGLVDHWIQNIRDVRAKHKKELSNIDDELLRFNRLSELHVVQQVANVSQTPFIQEAWRNGQELSIHGWIYDVKDGLLKNLCEPITELSQVDLAFQSES